MISKEDHAILSQARAVERSRNALRRLVTLDKPLRERALLAAREIDPIAHQTLPSAFQEDFDVIWEMLTAEGPDEKRGRIEASLDAMDNDELQEFLRLLLAFARDVERADAQWVSVPFIGNVE